MELSEVINPGFAFPVVGVVLCAVLVFAFGFKSPVQPPSFDFDDQERPKKKTKPKKPKTQSSNGHVVNIEVPGPKQTVPVPNQRQSPSSRTEPGASPKDLVKQKAKKASSPRANQTNVDSASGEPKKEDYAEGWTMAVSKKEKKHKGKRDMDMSPGRQEEVESFVKKTEEVTALTEVLTQPQVVVKCEPQTETTPQEQRVKRDKGDRNKKMTATDAADTPPVPNQDIADKENVADTKAMVPPSENKETVTPKRKAKVKKVKAAAVAAEDDSLSMSTPPPEAGTTAQTEAAKPVSPPAAKKALKAGKKQEDASDEASESNQSSQQAAEAHLPQTDTQTFSDARSPKKKKKAKDKQLQESAVSSSSNQSLPETSPTATAPSSGSSVAPPAALTAQSHTQSVPSGDSADRLGSASTAAAADGESLSSSLSSPPLSSSPDASVAKQPDSSTSTSQAAFDELGDWQDAKPVKKKKKARREN